MSQAAPCARNATSLAHAARAASPTRRLTPMHAPGASRTHQKAPREPRLELLCLARTGGHKAMAATFATLRLKLTHPGALLPRMACSAEPSPNGASGSSAFPFNKASLAKPRSPVRMVVWRRAACPPQAGTGTSASAGNNLFSAQTGKGRSQEKERLATTRTCTNSASPGRP